MSGQATPIFVGGSGGGVTDHGELDGLADDDHTQYALADGSRGAFASSAQGVLADSALQSGDLAGYASQSYVDASIAAIDLSGYATDSELSSGLATKADASHTHAASDIASGTIATARLGSGTADSTTYLRGDQTWQTIASGAAWGSITGTISSQTDVVSVANSQTISGAKTFSANSTHNGVQVGMSSSVGAGYKGVAVSGSLSGSFCGMLSSDSDTTLYFFGPGAAYWQMNGQNVMNVNPNSVNMTKDTSVTGYLVVYGPVRKGAYTFAGRPTASSYPGYEIVFTDRTHAGKLYPIARSDGTDWVYPDGTVAT